MRLSQKRFCSGYLILRNNFKHGIRLGIVTIRESDPNPVDEAPRLHDVCVVVHAESFECSLCIRGPDPWLTFTRRNQPSSSASCKNSPVPSHSHVTDNSGASTEHSVPVSVLVPVLEQSLNSGATTVYNSAAWPVDLTPIDRFCAPRNPIPRRPRDEPDDRSKGSHLSCQGPWMPGYE